MREFQKIRLFLARLNSVQILLVKGINWLLLFSAAFTMIVMVYDFGFGEKARDYDFKNLYILFAKLYLALGGFRLVLNSMLHGFRYVGRYFELLMWVLFVLVFELLTQNWTWSYSALLHPYYPMVIFPLYSLVFFHIFSVKASKLYQLDINPSAFFVLSFFILSCLGTLGLLLPNSSVEGMKFIDAFFVSVSAVCTTGLSTVDMAHDFTRFGHSIILVLMQLGGIGVMTFAGLLAKMFTAGSSFQQQKVLQSSFRPQTSLNEIITGDKLSEVMNTVYQIILITLLVELIGAVVIYFSTWQYEFISLWDRAFFAVFHSVSAFCNTGFTLPVDGMLHPAMMTNYSFQTTLALLYILGGIGFPVVLIFHKQLKLLLWNIYNKLVHHRSFIHTARFFTVNTKLVIWTTVIMITVSMFLVFVFEWNHALADRPFWGKMSALFFSATTPSYAGINIVDMNTLAYPTVVLYMFLIWVGASPESTGGGIKNTVFALGVLNLLNVARGREGVTIFGAKIGQSTLRRAYAVMSVSIVLMGIFTFWVYSFDGAFDFMHISFEIFSAFNNNGLSLGITSMLSVESKFILCLAMFAGRVGTLSLLSAFLYKKQLTNYKYPSQEIIF